MHKKLLMITLLTVPASTVFASPVTFAQAFQLSSNNELTIQNTGGTVTVSSTGHTDNFIFLVGGTPFGVATPVLADFTLNATSTQLGACGSATCPNADSFTEQGFVGSFSYTVATPGAYFGMTLLAGTFSVTATPTNSGGTLNEHIGASDGGYSGSQTGSNPNGIVFSSDFLNFGGVFNEAGSWGFSAGAPAFAVNPTAGQQTLPFDGQAFTDSIVGTFSSEPAPSSSPEPATMAIMGSALIGLGLLGRKRLSR
jgi:hypothetical protein